MTDTEPQDEDEVEGRVAKYGQIGPPCFDPQTGLWRLRYMPFAPSPKQAAFLGTTCRELFYGGAAGGGKANSVITPVMTPDGFRQIGNLHPGDYTFGADGKIHTIVGETEVFTADGWALTFDTGETLVVNDQHLWVTQTDTERRTGQDGTVRTTLDVVSSLADKHTVVGAAPVQLPSAKLPGDPYKVGRRFTTDPTTIIGEYMLGSEAQRLSFLQGMLDETGTTKPGSNSVVVFTHPDSAVTNVAAFLVRTLGMKTRVAQISGEWEAEFRANTRHVFRSKAKQSQLKHGLKQSRMRHQIVDAVRVCDVEFKCIQTSATDHQFLVGLSMIPTHNSVALLAAALQFADVPGYAALILRRNLTDLTQPGALIAMSRQWLDGRPDCTYNANERKWTFKNGGVIQFGYLNHVQDLGRYKGPLRPETEVLTDDGWTPICDVKVGDNVASFDPVTRAAGMQPVSATHEWDYDDDLVTVHQRTGVSFAATPDHTIWYRTKKLPELRRGRVGEVTSSHGQIWIPRNGTWTDGEPPESREFVPANRKGPKVPTVRFSPEDWVEFLGWYVSEGHVGINKERNFIGITQKMPEHQKRIEALLDRIGAKWHRYDNRHYGFSNSALADYLRDNCGKLAAGKCLPREVFTYAPEYRRILLDTLVDGDGSHYPDEGGKMLFVTTSEQLWNDVSELATRCGLTATTGTSPRMNFDGSERDEPALTYRVSITDRAGRDREVKRDDVQRERYTGKVHCLTVAPWHSIIIRYRGRVSVTGNTEYHYIAFDELSEFPLESTYKFMFSRLRRPKNLSREEIVRLYGQSADGMTLLDLPLRVRSASNPGGPGCVPYGDVLTPTGWVPIQDMAVGDPVFTVDKDGALTQTEVGETHEYDWSGDLVKVDARGFRAVVTPNHNMVKVGGVRRGLATRGGATDKFSLVPFEELPGQATILRSVQWVGVSIGEVTPEPVPSRKLKNANPTSLPPESYCRLLGWYLSEGHTVARDKAFEISQTKQCGRDEIRRLLEDECGFTTSWSNVGVTVYSATWWQHFAPFGHAHQKFIPEHVKAGTKAELWALLDALMRGDGSWYNHVPGAGSGTYYTSSPQLASDVAEIALKCGFIVSHQIRDRRGPTRIEGRDVTTNHLSHEIVMKPATKSGGTEILTGQHKYNVTTTTERRSDIQRVHYDGKVYCITVPETHTFIIRQRGSVWVSGNSGWAKIRFVDVETRRAPFMPATFRDNPAIDDDEYLESLAELDEVERRRLELGDWTIQEIPGALWKLAGIERFDWSREQGTAMFDRVYIGLDPSVGEGAGDECGIVAGGIRSSGQVVVLEDGSIRAHPDIWSQRAVTLYHVLDASGIVIEKNQGAELLRTQIRDAADQLGMPQPVVHLANAKGSKEWRAGTITSGYTNPIGNPLIKHATGLAGGELEAQMVGWVPGSRSQTVKSPDRVDGLVWMLRGLLYPNDLDDFSKTVSTPGGLVDKFRSW